MKAVTSLPEGYKEIYKIDLEKNKKTALLVNLGALIIAAILIVPVHIFYIPITKLFYTDDGVIDTVKFVSLFVLSILYIVLHELVHGVAMKICGTKKIRYGFRGLYAFAGSDDYYAKKPYIFIALAPVILWGTVIAVMNCFVPEDWFWVVYFIQISNLSGAAGDLFVTVKFSRMPKDILIKDYGVGMTVFSKEK